MPKYGPFKHLKTGKYLIIVSNSNICNLYVDI